MYAMCPKVAEADHTLLCLQGKHGIGVDERSASEELDSCLAFIEGHLPFSSNCAELRGSSCSSLGIHVLRTQNTAGRVGLYVLSYYPAKQCLHPSLIGCQCSMIPLSLCNFHGRFHQGIERSNSVTPFGPFEASRVLCTTSQYMLRSNTREPHVQPCHTFDIDWSYSLELNASGDHTYCMRLSVNPSACHGFYHT